MAADFYLVQNDAGAVMTKVLSDVNGAVDLTTAITSKLVVSKPGGTPIVNTPATPNADQVNNKGSISYTFTSGDSANPIGIYEMQFDITFPAGKIQTFPNPTKAILEIGIDLG